MATTSVTSSPSALGLLLGLLLFIIVSSVSPIPAFWEQDGLNGFSGRWLLGVKGLGKLLTGSKTLTDLIVESWGSHVQFGEQIEHLTGVLKMLGQNALGLHLSLRLILTVSLPTSSSFSSATFLGHSCPTGINISVSLVNDLSDIVILELVLINLDSLLLLNFFLDLFLSIWHQQLAVVGQLHNLRSLSGEWILQILIDQFLLLGKHSLELILSGLFLQKE